MKLFLLTRLISLPFHSDDKIADVCIPQVFTVAALEPINETTTKTTVEGNAPSYKNIYNYLSSITKGCDVGPLNNAEASIVLSLLEDLILTLSKSQTLIQKEYLHSNYNELRKYFLPNGKKPEHVFPSINPFGIPSDLINFQFLEQCSSNEQGK